MDDLVATISGSMHVSQAGYNIKALQVSILAPSRIKGGQLLC